MNKIKTREEITKIAKELKLQGKKIVTINGCFDLLHTGHVHMLEEAKQQGDVLIVGLNSDKSVKSYKGLSRAIIPEHDRARMLAALECVDYVTLFDETDCLAFVDSVRPNVHVNGPEYGENCIEAPLVKKHGGRIHIAKKVEGLSTSGIIKKIKEM